MSGVHDCEPFTVRIEDGNVYLSWPDGDYRARPLRIARIEHQRIADALAEHDARCARVVPFTAKGGG